MILDPRWKSLVPDHREWFVAVDADGSVYAYLNFPESEDSTWNAAGEARYLGDLGHFADDIVCFDENNDCYEGWDDEDNILHILAATEADIIEYNKLQNQWRNRLPSAVQLKRINTVNAELYEGITIIGSAPELIHADGLQFTRFGITTRDKKDFRAPYYMYEVDTAKEEEDVVRAATRAVA